MGFGKSRRSDAQIRSGRRTNSQHAKFPRLGRRRRIQCRSRFEQSFQKENDDYHIFGQKFARRFGGRFDNAGRRGCFKYHWKTDSINTRNGLYFIERGFGLMSPKSCFDRDNTAVSQLKPDDFDWQKIFKEKGVSWLHTGGIFTGLSETTPEVAKAAMKAARDNGTIVSYDLNYRDSLWKDRGGKDEANKLNKELLPFADVVFGVPDYASSIVDFDSEGFRTAVKKLQDEFPNLKVYRHDFPRSEIGKQTQFDRRLFC